MAELRDLLEDEARTLQPRALPPYEVLVRRAGRRRRGRAVLVAAVAAVLVLAVTLAPGLLRREPPAAPAMSPPLITGVVPELGVRFRYPRVWQRVDPDDGPTTGRWVFAYLGTGPLRPPCTHTGDSQQVTRCGLPVRRLTPRGVLVSWSREDGAWAPGHAPDARRSDRAGSAGEECRAIGATWQRVVVFGHRIRLTACVAAPDATGRAQVDALVRSVRFLAPAKHADYTRSGLAFAYPASWHRGTFPYPPASFFDVLDHFSSDPLREPCTRRPSHGGIETTCSLPVGWLSRGGVVVTWQNWGVPAPVPASSREGVPSEVDGRPAWTTSEPAAGSCAAHGGRWMQHTDVLPRPSDTRHWFAMDACFAEPRARAEAQVRAMLDSVRLDPS